MKTKITMTLIIVLTLFLTISIVFANENVSDITNSTQKENLPVLENNTAQEMEKSQTTITAPNITTYTDIETTLTIKLTSNGTKLTNKTIKILLNNTLYENITDSNGEINFKFKLTNGTYLVEYYFSGDGNYTSSNTTSTIKVNSEYPTYLDVADKYINYRAGSKSIFQLKLTTINNIPLSQRVISIKVAGKTYYAKTNTKGIATFYLKLKAKKYTIWYSFSKNQNYSSSSGSYKITVKPKLKGGYGYWVDRWSMKEVNLKKLSKKGTKHIFLLHSVFTHYGKSTVVKWIKKAHKYGMKVHIWMAVFFKNGKFVRPVSKKGNYNYDYINKMIKQAKYYASIKGVDGIHFDYLRFGGNAYKFKNAVKVINYFVKKASTKVHKIKPKLIVSAAVMPEPSSMKYYYGQDTKTMSKYLDVIIPMIYKGNYHAKSSWIKKITKKFVKMSKGAKIWAGLQTYKSDSNIKKLTYKALFKDAKNAIKGKASGVVLFRWGLSPLINFKKL